MNSTIKIDALSRLARWNFTAS